GFLHQFAVGRIQHVLPGLDQTLGQGQFVFLGAATVLLDQQGRAGILQRHHHHRAVTGAGADQAFIGTFGAVAEPQLHLLHGEQAAFRDYAGVEDVWLLRHAVSVVPGWSVIVAVHLSKTQLPCLTGTPSILSCWIWTALCWICISTITSGSSTCRGATPASTASPSSGPGNGSFR